MTRKSLLEYAANRYSSEPEYPWIKYPDLAVLRHSDNQKWFALFMEVSGDKLGLSEADPVEILNVKCDPVMAVSLRSVGGILPAYHMNKANWISVMLDGTVPDELVLNLLEMSYELTAKKKKAAKKQA